MTELKLLLRTQKVKFTKPEDLEFMRIVRQETESDDPDKINFLMIFDNFYYKPYNIKEVTFEGVGGAE